MSAVADGSHANGVRCQRLEARFPAVSEEHLAQSA
jgi:hypothetical protein